MRRFLGVPAVALLLLPALRAQDEALDQRAREMVRAARTFAEGAELESFEEADLSRFLENRGALLVTSVAAVLAQRVWQEVATARYGAPDPGEARRAVARMFDEFDFAGIGVFATEVRRLAEDPEVRRFLEDLVRRLLDPGAEVDLWALAVLRRGGDEREAIRLLAVVFQDLEGGPPGALHLIEDRAVAELWARALILVREADLSRVRLYPDGLAVPEDPWIYHYYVPAELAARLREKGLAPRAAFLAPFVMNTEYERYHVEIGGPDQGLLRRASVLWAGPSRPFDETEANEATRVESIRDIYLGYRGALRGSGCGGTPASLAEVEEGLRRDPRALVQRLVREAE